MDHYIAALHKIIPKELQVLQRRFRILRNIKNFGPIGRRALSDKIHFSEKHVRTETDFLKQEGFINVTRTGMIITSVGEALLDELEEFIEKVEGLTTIETQVKDILQCEEVVIVQGDADVDEYAMHNIGHAAAKVVLKKITDNEIIAITGGSTMEKVVESIIPYGNMKFDGVTVVPARGSLGNVVNYQANTLAAVLAAKLGCQYRLLNIPDNLSEKALESVRQEPEIQRALDMLIRANLLVYGIGEVKQMAGRRRLDQEVIELLEKEGATAEALGYYFGKDGNVVYAHRSIGITIDQMTELKYSIAVAGGRSKSEAILSVKKLLAKGCVIMDEGAANGLIALANYGKHP